MQLAVPNSKEIRKAMIDCDLNTKSLSEISNTNRSDLSLIVRGFKNVTLEKASRISIALNRDLQDLFDLRDNRNTTKWGRIQEERLG